MIVGMAIIPVKVILNFTKYVVSFGKQSGQQIQAIQFKKKSLKFFPNSVGHVALQYCLTVFCCS